MRVCLCVRLGSSAGLNVNYCLPLRLPRGGGRELGGGQKAHN